MVTALSPWMNEYGDELALDTRISLTVGRTFTNRGT
jgi:hypothetical protein